MRTSPGWSIAIASCTVTTDGLRSTPFSPRASIRSLIELSMELSGQNPSTQLFISALRSEGMDCLKARALVELRRIENRLDTVSVDCIGPVALHGIRHEIRRELDHARSRVLPPLLIEAHGDSLHRLEQCCEQKTNWSCADHVHSHAGGQSLRAFRVRS